MNSFHAHGKLLVSAEYMVLFGSRALAIPLQLGQSLQRIRSAHPRIFSWKAIYGDKPWFSATMDAGSLKIIASSDPVRAEWLRSLIRAAIEIMPSFQEDLFRWDVETQLDFSPEWGLGSSSTVTALVAEWAEVNPIDLHFMISEGSGYDVACAIADGPIQYQIRDYSPHYQHVPFRPPFAPHLYFAWLGHKQPTEAHLREIKGRIKPNYEEIHRFSRITEGMIAAEDLSTFRALMEEHEDALSTFLEIEKISETRLHGIPGTVKSLGAWGGDFVMIASDTDEKDLFDYLHERDIRIIYRYNDIVYAKELQG